MWVKNNIVSLPFYHVQSDAQVGKVEEHRALISDLQNSKDQTMFITASKDNSAKVLQSNAILYTYTLTTLYIHFN